MGKFNAKDYIIEDLKAVTSANLNSGGNFSVSLLPDGKKGFIINRAKKQMTVDYEHARILDEKQQEMNREQVYQFISALKCDTINMPAGSGFADITKGKTYAEQLYYYTTQSFSNSKLLRDLVCNDLAFINIIKRGPYDTEKMDFSFEDIQAIQSIWLHYMSQEELASEITDYIFKINSGGNRRHRALVHGWKTIKTLLNYYTQEEIYIYLDEWVVAIQHSDLPEEDLITSLFEGYQDPVQDINFPEVDLLDGRGYKYNGRDYSAICGATRMLTDECLSSPKNPYEPASIFIVPSKDKISIPINDFTQMAVYGAIAQGYTGGYEYTMQTFFREWRRNIDYQLYFDEQITNIAPRNIESSNREIAAQRDVEIISRKIAEAYRIKYHFYMQEIKDMGLTIPYTSRNGVKITLASEEDVIAMATKYYQSYNNYTHKLHNIIVMMCTESIPLNIINPKGTLIDTHFYDISVLIGGRIRPRQFVYDGTTYYCAACQKSKSYTPIDSIWAIENRWYIPNIHSVPNRMLFTDPIEIAEEYFEEWMQNRTN